MRYVLIAVLLVVACGDGAEDPEPLGLGEWAAVYCGAINAAMNALPDDATEPASLEGAREQAIEIMGAITVAMRSATDPLEAVTAPPEAASFHRATIDAYRTFAEFAEGAMDDLATADTTEDVNVVQANMSIAFHDVQAAMSAATDDIDPVVLVALSGCM